MSFEEDFLHGYTKHTKIFDKWCEHAEPLLGDVRQCVRIELSSDGNAFIVANAPDIGEQSLTKKWYNHQKEWSFYENLSKNEITTGTSQFGHENSRIYTKDFRMSWFTLREIKDQDTQIIYGFASNHPSIYDNLIQNFTLIKKFLKFFHDENQKIFDYHRDRKFNLASVSTNFFRKHEDVDQTDREKLNQLLQTMGVLDEHTRITPREWQCIKMLEFGKTADKTGEILNISRRTVEAHFNNLKEKFKVRSKSELRDMLC